ncbi:phosphoglycerate mutase-like protein 4 [Lotus japonicus]|uniref:phosphoglycerate mutase-like protein 4 n=1 Tax=Lotus japonicus TaxID=34305 RepID=UPI00258A869F|nr:phosphoglycerate mutase-like protein 4 [Lotus japonicus]
MAESSINDSFSSHPHLDLTEIVVVRHGETAWNAQGLIQGQADIELNEAGRMQAAAVAKRLSREPKISAVYSSDAQRALETAQIIASTCGGLEVFKDFDLRERHMGELQGLVYHGLEKTNPIGYKALKSEDENQKIPGGGESIVQLFERCKSALLRIGRNHKGERVVVVSHGASIHTLHKWACPNERSTHIHNTSISVFHLYGEDKWTLKIWGDVSHLNQNGFLQSGFGGNKTSA